MLGVDHLDSAGCYYTQHMVLEINLHMWWYKKRTMYALMYTAIQISVWLFSIPQKKKNTWLFSNIVSNFRPSNSLNVLSNFPSSKQMLLCILGTSIVHNSLII